MAMNHSVRPLLELSRRRDVNRLFQFVTVTDQLTQDELRTAYHQELLDAPRRATRGKPYFGPERQGIPGTAAATNRGEEHLALAIVNHHRQTGTPLLLPDGEALHFLDYQVPLKASQQDQGVGKIDLFGVMLGRPAIVELKAGTGNDTPLRALLEGLAYAAIVQANVEAIRVEARQRFQEEIREDIPMVIVMAPVQYWTRFQSNPVVGNWRHALWHLRERIITGIGVQVACLALHNTEFEFGLNGMRPQLKGVMSCTDIFEEIQ